MINNKIKSLITTSVLAVSLMSPINAYATDNNFKSVLNPSYAQINDIDNVNDSNIWIISQYEQEVASLVNKERVRRGLAPLKYNYDLGWIARLKSKDMVNKNYFSHYSPTYGSPFKMMESRGIRFVAAGENIAKGQKTPAEVMKGWMNSPGHRNNILSPIYKEIGVGVAQLKNGTFCWTQMFIKPR